MKAKRYTVTDAGPDVDLAVEDIRLADGTRLTNEVADSLAAEIRRAPFLSRADSRPAG